MIQIDNTLVSLDVLERQFLCDLSHCKGICCVEGDSGAPLLEEEVGELEKALPVVMMRTELASVRWRRPIAKVSSLSINRFPATFTRYVWKSTTRSKRLITIAGVSAKPQRYWVRKKNSRSISF